MGAGRHRNARPAEVPAFQSPELALRNSLTTPTMLNIWDSVSPSREKGDSAPTCTSRKKSADT